MDYKKKLLELLELADTATDEEIQAAVAALESVGEEVETQETEMTNRIAELEAELTNRDLDAHGITDPNERKAWGNVLNADRVSGLACLANRKPAEPARQNLTNRYPGKTPGAIKPPEDTRSLRNRAVSEFQATNKCEFEAAWNAVRAAKPELFKEEEQ